MFRSTAINARIWINIETGIRFLLEDRTRIGVFLTILGNSDAPEIFFPLDEFDYCFNPWFEPLDLEF